MIQRVARALVETEEIASYLASRAQAAMQRGELGHVLIGLLGDLGAGKTAFVRGFVGGLDPDAAERVSSPTYSIVHTYPTSPVVRHLDLYRLETMEELEGIGWRELYFSAGITLVEWALNVESALGNDWLEIRLAIRGRSSREITFVPHGRAYEKLIETM